MFGGNNLHPGTHTVTNCRYLENIFQYLQHTLWILDNIFLSKILTVCNLFSGLFFLMNTKRKVDWQEFSIKTVAVEKILVWRGNITLRIQHIGFYICNTSGFLSLCKISPQTYFGLSTCLEFIGKIVLLFFSNVLSLINKL